MPDVAAVRVCSHLRGAGDRRSARRWAVGLGRNRDCRGADEGLLCAAVVGERHPHRDDLALVGSNRRVGHAAGTGDGNPICQPLVAVSGAIQSVGVCNARRDLP